MGFLCDNCGAPAESGASLTLRLVVRSERTSDAVIVPTMTYDYCSECFNGAHSAARLALEVVKKSRAESPLAEPASDAVDEKGDGR